MKIVIYESSSFGGCYHYAVELFKAFSNNKNVEKITFLLPTKTNFNEKNVHAILCNDRKIGKLNFLIRQILNPFILFQFLLFKKKSYVIFNDFEQTFSYIWVPFFRFFLRKHRFAVVLHDPDRDAYPPSKKYSAFCMKHMMKMMHIGLYHEHLPEKSYYKANNKTKYLSVPHGIYKSEVKDDLMYQNIIDQKDNKYLLLILGNIRKEKNYELAIESLQKLTNCKLIIAGSPANSNINTNDLKHLAEQLKVQNKIIWIERYLSNAEMSAVIESSDIVLLNYSRSFTSQSGIMNQIAPFQKKVVISNVESGLSSLARKFSIGTFCEPDSLQSLTASIQNSISNDSSTWTNYLNFASWNNNIEIIIREFLHLEKK